MDRAVSAMVATTIINDNGEHDIDGRGLALYPWALIGKSGRTREDECMIHLVNDKGKMKDSTAGPSSCHRH